MMQRSTNQSFEFLGWADKIFLGELSSVVPLIANSGPKRKSANFYVVAMVDWQ